MAETIQDTLDRITAFVSQNYTDIEVGPGSVVGELLLKVAAKIQNEQYNKIDALDQGKSIQSVLASTTDTYSSVIDEIASNYNVSRGQGTQVRGKIKVTIAKAGEHNFRAGLRFIQPALNLAYTLTQDTRVTQTPSIPELNEVQLYLSQGMFYFVLDVVAEAAGPEYQVPAGSLFTLDSNNYINNFVTAEAYGNFSSGSAVDTDKQLIAKIKNSLGNTRFESESGIYNQFSQTFSGFQGLSVCGANDVELVRAKRNVLGVSTFGKADVYVRSSLGPEIVRLIKTATKIDAGVWEMQLTNQDLPGFYYIQSIIPMPANNTTDIGGTLVPTDVVYGYATYAGQRNNDIRTVQDARFTKYQTARVTFLYSDTPSSQLGSTIEFEVHAVCQPNITEMQDLLLSDSRRLACADYLVKAVVPCMTSVDISLVKKRNTDTFTSLNLSQLKKDLFVYINSLPFGSDLQASNLVDICHNYDIKRVDLPISMSGSVLCPDGSIISLFDHDVLTIPTSVKQGVSPKTTAYFIDYYRTEAGVTHPVDNIGLTLL